MYSPKISEELIPVLYRMGKEHQIPMTGLVDRLLRKALAPSKEEVRPGEDERAVTATV